MKKSELRALIKEMLQEELAAMDKPSESETVTEEPKTDVLEETLTEAPVMDKPSSSITPGSYLDLALDIYLSDEFNDTLARAHGDIYSDEVEDLVAKVVDRTYRNLPPSQRQKAIQMITKELNITANGGYDDDDDGYASGYSNGASEIANYYRDTYGDDDGYQY